MLREVARIFAASVRKSDIICRYGGEEFCAILPETTSAQAYTWAENIRKQIAATEVILDAAVVNVTVSMGLAEPLSEMEDLSDLIDVADHCLLDAKSKGRNQIVAFNELRESVRNDPSGHLESVFQGAIAADAMTPVVCTVTPQSCVFDISQFFLDYRIPSAPVVDDEGNLVGIVSDKDLLSVAVRANPHEIEIAAVMRRNLVCYPPNISLRVVWEFLNRVSVRTVLITENDKAVGVLSRQSILRWFANTAWKRKDDENPIAFQTEHEQQLAMRRLEQAAKILAETSRQLTYDVETRTPDEHGAMVIGTVSKMQDLMVELLASVGGNSGMKDYQLHSAIGSPGE